MATEGFEGKGLEFYRCMMCSEVVSIWDIQKHGGCRVCASPRIKPTNLSLREKAIQLFKHPAFWKWKNISL